jgi:hypothetical protein
MVTIGKELASTFKGSWGVLPISGEILVLQLFETGQSPVRALSIFPIHIPRQWRVRDPLSVDGQAGPNQLGFRLTDHPGLTPVQSVKFVVPASWEEQTRNTSRLATICSSLNRLFRRDSSWAWRAILNGEVTFPMDQFSGGQIGPE